MIRPYLELDQERRIESLESVLWYARDQLLRRMFGTVFEDIIDRIDAVLPGQLAQDIAEWCNTYNKRIVMVRHATGNIEVDPEFAKEQS